MSPRFPPSEVDCVSAPLGKRPPRRDHRPEHRREGEAVSEQGHGVATLDRVLGEEDVERVRERAADRERDPGRREALTAAEQVDDQREAREREPERDPDAAPHVLVVDEPRPERDEQRRQVLDQQRDPDREPVDCKEVEPLHEGQSGDAEDDEVRKLPPRDAKAARRGERHDDQQSDRGPERAHLREPLGRQPGREDRLRDRAVDPPENRRGRRHRVAEARVTVPRARDGERCFGHRADEPTLWRWRAGETSRSCSRAEGSTAC